MLATCRWVNAAGLWKREIHTDFVGWALKTSTKRPRFTWKLFKWM